MTWLAARIRDENPTMLEDFRWALDLVDRIQAARGAYEPCQVHTDATHVNIILAPEGIASPSWTGSSSGPATATWTWPTSRRAPS